jgi:DNA-binding GntR family transcriptional regulator
VSGPLATVDSNPAPLGDRGVELAGNRGGSTFKAPALLGHELASHLEDQIVFGELPQNARLVEETIVRQYGVSRSPVREALRSLEQSGLAVRQSRKGVSVSATSRKDLDEVYACRMVLEGLAAEEAARHRSDADVAALGALVEQLEQAAAARDIREYFRHNVSMSSQICSAASNATLTRLLASLGKQALRYRYMVYSRLPGMIDVSLEANRAIVEAIARQNARHARSLTEDVIQRSWRSIAGQVDEGEQNVGATKRNV